MEISGQLHAPAALPPGKDPYMEAKIQQFFLFPINGAASIFLARKRVFLEVSSIQYQFHPVFLQLALIFCVFCYCLT
jgi:hypothetical protein